MFKLAFASRSQKKRLIRIQVCSLFSICTPRSVLWPSLLSAQRGWPLYNLITQVLLLCLPVGFVQWPVRDSGGQETEELGHLFPFLVSRWVWQWLHLNPQPLPIAITTVGLWWQLSPVPSGFFLLFLVHKCFAIPYYWPCPHLCK